MSIAPIDSYYLDYIWYKLEPYIEKALAHSDNKFNLDSIGRECREGNYLAWMVYNSQEITGCLITELLQYPCSRRLSVLLLAADDFSDVVCDIDRFRTWAKQNGADAIECYGRPGWEKLLKDHDFQKIHTLLRMKVDDFSKELKVKNSR